MSTSKTLYYKDYAGTWRACYLQFYQTSGLKGYILPNTSVEIEPFLTCRKIFLARIDVLDCWYIPDIAPNTAMLEQLVEEQREAFESDIKAHWLQ